MDNGKEFVLAEFENWCLENKINMLKNSPSKNQSDGRLERLNKKLWCATRKCCASKGEVNIKEDLKEIIRKFNNTLSPRYQGNTYGNMEWRTNRSRNQSLP